MPGADDLLLTVPNVSEGRDPTKIARIADAFTSTGATLLDVHSDADHHRSVYTLSAADTHTLVSALAAGAGACIELIDLTTPRGSHPHVGALDVVPIVYLDPARRGAACAAALVAAEELGRAGLPVFLYGEVAAGRSRAHLRRGGLRALTERIATDELQPDFGPKHPDPRTGATLVGARPPLVAFNIELAPPATLAQAQTIAARIREGGPDGLPGVRAIGIELAAARGKGPVAQVSTNVEDHHRTPLAHVIRAVARHAAVARCELVGLAPRAAFDDFPDDVLVANRRTIEDGLSS